MMLCVSGILYIFEDSSSILHIFKRDLTQSCSIAKHMEIYYMYVNMLTVDFYSRWNKSVSPTFLIYVWLLNLIDTHPSITNIIPHLHNLFLFQCDVTRSLNRYESPAQTVWPRAYNSVSTVSIYWPIQVLCCVNIDRLLQYTAYHI